MTTEELKKELEELGLELHEEVFRYRIKEKETGIEFARVSTVNECNVDVHSSIFDNPERIQKLFNAVMKYAATPIEERKHYYKYRLKPISKGVDGLLYHLGYDDEFCVFILEDMNSGDICKTIFEENDPLLKDINLEMFEAVEVDAEGNELHD